MLKSPRDKGNRTERAVAEIINGILNAKLRRTPMSGAMSDFPGDLFTLHDQGRQASKWLWEVKNRKNGIQTVLKWYKKAAEETPLGKKPVVVATANNENFYVFLTLKDFLQLLRDLDVHEFGFASKSP